jgi:large subunit ribosomal protein L22
MATKSSSTERARAIARNMSISAKHSIELCRWLRYKTTAQAKRMLEDVITYKLAVPFKRFNRDVGHKPGMAAGRYPIKASKELMKLIESVEANAQFNGLHTGQLKIVKLIANKAAVPITGGRRNRGTKRTHIEIEVKELHREEKKRKEVKKEAKKLKEKEVRSAVADEKKGHKGKEEATKKVNEKKTEATEKPKGAEQAGEVTPRSSQSSSQSSGESAQ